MKKNPSLREFAPMLELLPKNCREFPALFNEDELSYLEGSPFRDVVADVQQDYLEIYERIREAIPDFQEFDIGQFFETM